jgi:type II secretory pathway pseudopilin PulG
MLGKFLLEQLTAQPPKSQGQTTTWRVPVEAVLKSGVSDLLSAAILQAGEQRTQHQLRSLALALHNYYSAMKKFPSPLSGADGKSPRKLSWRVDLLPFLDHSDLYQQFHLDEAWDSPHNRSLIPKMPNVFRVPQSKHSTESGLSTFVLPSNAVTMWPTDREIDFKDIEDGTSNTIMIVEIKDELAQEWTRPDTLEINIKNPAPQLGGHFKDKIFFAAGDGSSSFVGSEKFGNLPALLTRAGGEVVAW